MRLIALTALAYSSGILPTVTIKTENGPVRINEDDFDAETMELFDSIDTPDEPAEPQAPAEPEAPAEQLLVMKSGRKFFITNTLGQKVEGDAAEGLGIDADGYTTEAAANAALAALTA